MADGGVGFRRLDGAVTGGTAARHRGPAAAVVASGNRQNCQERESEQRVFHFILILVLPDLVTEQALYNVVTVTVLLQFTAASP